MIAQTLPAIPDAEARERFANEIDRNFMVNAAAGSGKTQGISRRVTAIGLSRHAETLLPRLVVATYTRKAAEEMRQRAREEIMRAGVAPSVLRAFSDTYFGTIHSFGVQLLKDFGRYLGLPANFAAVAEGDDAALWREFLKVTAGRPGGMPAADLDRLLQHLGYGTLLDLVRIAEPGATVEVPGSYPSLELLVARAQVALGTECKTKNAAHMASLEGAKEELRSFIAAVGRASPAKEFLPVPEFTRGGAEFIAAAGEAVMPVRAWLSRAGAQAVAQLAEEYRSFRVSRGRLTFADQIALAAKLFTHPEAAEEIRRRNYSVILDEAQDTDPVQFELLVEATRPVEAVGRFLADTSTAQPPAPGRFSMVGDFQQSIYSDRADLAVYRAAHAKLIATRSAEALTFAVTFRCDHAIVDFCNSAFPQILDSENGQVPFIPMQARPAAGVGAVVRLPFHRAELRGVDVPASLAPLEEGASKEAKAAAKAAQAATKAAEKTVREAKARAIASGEEARFIAAWMAERGPSRLGARRWGDVAILLPRKKWMRAFVAALREQKIEAQIVSPYGVVGDNVTYAWATALAVCMAEPRNSFEVAGVLREVFGLRDDDLARYVATEGRANGERLNLLDAPQGTGPVFTVLAQLHELRSRVWTLPVRQGLETLLRETALLARVQSLPGDLSHGAERTLDTILLMAGTVQASGGTFSEFARAAKRGFFETARPATSHPDKVVLITNLMSKGLQWDTVIVPSLDREIRDRPPSYPCVLPRVAGGIVAYSKADIPPAATAAIEREGMNELERIAYVTMTRAKRALILVDGTVDGAPAADFSLATALRLETPLYRALPADVPAAAWAPEAAGIVAGGALSVAPTELTVDWVAAQASASQFPRRHLPHSLASKLTRRAAQRRQDSRQRMEDPEQTLTGEVAFVQASETRDDAVSYGVWFHGLMERFPFAADETSQLAYVTAGLAACPAPRRGELETKLLLGSKWLVEFRRPGWTLHPEFPIFVPLDRDNCVDGVIDLLAEFRGESGSRWVVVDYKTNANPTPRALVTSYRGQMSTYEQALRLLVGATAAIDLTLYSSALGQAVQLS